jgi:hypothetical protein
MAMTREEWRRVFKNERGQELIPLSWWGRVEAALADPEVPITALCCMRQAGKTTFGLQEAGFHLVTVPGALVLFIAGSEGQGQELFGRKFRRPIAHALHELGVARRRVIFTKRSVELLETGARLEVLAPSEVSGVGRAATFMVFDESRYIPDSVFATLLPSIWPQAARCWWSARRGTKKDFSTRS